jgi:hypothetical protein
MLNPISVRNSLSPIFDPTRSVLADQSTDDALEWFESRKHGAAVPTAVRSVTAFEQWISLQQSGPFLTQPP